ncbi:hypothetical protein C0992_011967 [Termitomyces sp. T32_za158]|nr:hypothetical protein C0992_011967 [Termitomyces sp. T32_za158]
MGCSPYYAATGTHPLLPADVMEATYLQPTPNSLLSTTNLVARCTVNLQQCSEDLVRLHETVFSARRLAALRFETDHSATIKDYDFKRGSLVLMRNSKIETTHNKKMHPRYLGPLVVISHNGGGAYVLCKLDGSVLHCLIAAFWLLPYLACDHISLLLEVLDINTAKLQELEETELLDDDDLPPIEDSD